MDKDASTIPVTSYPEESGWTTYLEGFSGDNEGSFCSILDGSSMISDAASGAAWKFLQNNRFPKESGVEPNIPRKVNVKTPRAKEISQDDSLEDTASSPVNSPKIENKSGCPKESGTECQGLKKRGLCLVPMSMLVNYYR